MHHACTTRLTGSPRRGIYLYISNRYLGCPLLDISNQKSYTGTIFEVCHGYHSQLQHQKEMERQMITIVNALMRLRWSLSPDYSYKVKSWM